MWRLPSLRKRLGRRFMRGRTLASVLIQLYMGTHLGLCDRKKKTRCVMKSSGAKAKLLTQQVFRVYTLSYFCNSNRMLGGCSARILYTRPPSCPICASYRIATTIYGPFIIQHGLHFSFHPEGSYAHSRTAQVCIPDTSTSAHRHETVTASDINVTRHAHIKLCI
ncbi:hypothetical protein P153DRAFT_35314 [Dothidotthia symphoricarpi CBS 119687]|uniref:Uncharacterized protein n=1 Tax=Dothidotthia symphoricarpi CBS 119687 TaxID=1392245 RepID=A0A6A6A969_9PLEO|nr:uncharacterized protein P153DRAFT_35314 [Dothidotthia symphoricarpi CBS 119687]KAF2128350.1 hypothetical protein P153DRAFT_35314 [Dothidotthia symphoricarpi CBS 119687]